MKEKRIFKQENLIFLNFFWEIFPIYKKREKKMEPSLVEFIATKSCATEGSNGPNSCIQAGLYIVWPEPKRGWPLARYFSYVTAKTRHRVYGLLGMNIFHMSIPFLFIYLQQESAFLKPIQYNCKHLKRSEVPEEMSSYS